MSVSDIFHDPALGRAGQVGLAFSCISLFLLLICPIATITAYWYRYYYFHIINLWLIASTVVSLFTSWVPYNFIFVIHTGEHPNVGWAYVLIVVASGLTSYLLMVALLLCLYDRERQIEKDRVRGKEE